MRGWIVALLLLTVAFAGCASDDPKDEAGDGTTTATGSSSTSSSSLSGGQSGTTSASQSGSSTQSGTTAPGENHAPTLVITLAAGQSPNGSAPLAVTFLLNGTDADGDALSWTLAFADGSQNATGAALPAEQNHTFSTEGTYNVTFVVSDGKATVTATYPIAVLSGGAPAPAPIVIAGKWNAGSPVAGAYVLYTCEASPADGQDSSFFQVPAEAAGRSFTATVAATGPVAEWAVFMTNPSCGTADDDYETFSAEGTGEIKGTVLPGWTVGAFSSIGGAQLTATLTIA